MDTGNSLNPNTAHSLDELLNNVPCNNVIGDNLIRAWHIINSKKYKTIICSISGGSDSDIIIDICTRIDLNRKIVYIYFDTGLEFNATKEHLKYLEVRYNIKILVYRAADYGMSIPKSCKIYGQPFLSRGVSENIHRLQRHDFKWENKPFDVLYAEYPKCKSALEWWCNTKPGKRNNISWNRWLKEFLIENPPAFTVSNMCCQKSKKDISHKLIKEINCDLIITGIRKGEGGARANLNNCFNEKIGTADEYRPIFWYTAEDKRCYERHYNIKHSRCYSEYGLKRTGCCGCSYGLNLSHELKVLEEYEPKLYRAVCHIFKDSYSYTEQYRKFCRTMNAQC